MSDSRAPLAAWPIHERSPCGDCGGTSWYYKGEQGWVCTKCYKTHAKSSSQAIDQFKTVGELREQFFYQDSSEEIRRKIELIRNSVTEYELKIAAEVKEAAKYGEPHESSTWLKTKEMNRKAQILTLENSLKIAEAREKAEAIKRKRTPSELIKRL